MVILLPATNTPDDAHKSLEKLKEAVNTVRNSEVYPKLEDPFTLEAFDIVATSRLLPPSFPRAVVLMNSEQTYSFIINLCDQVEMILAIPKACGLVETLKHFDSINKLDPCVLVRSMLLYYFLPTHSNKVYNKLKLTDLVSDELKNFNSPPVVSAVYKPVLTTNEDVRLIFNAFLTNCAHVMEGLLTAKCNTMARQRERLAMLLEEFGVLQSESERTDAVLDTVLRDKIGEKAAASLSSTISMLCTVFVSPLFLNFLVRWNPRTDPIDGTSTDTIPS